MPKRAPMWGRDEGGGDFIPNPLNTVK